MKNIKRFFTMLLAIVMVASISATAFAADVDDDLLAKVQESVVALDGTVLPPDNGGISMHGGDLTEYYDRNMTSNGPRITGKFKVTNSSESVYLVWAAQSDNTPTATAAVFQCTIYDSNGIRLDVQPLLHGDSLARRYSFGRLAVGEYEFSIGPYTVPSGYTYRCVCVFVSA